MKPQKLLGIFLLTFGMLISLNGCMEKEISEILGSLNEQNDRITKLEELSVTLNSQITELKNLAEVAETTSDYITDVAPLQDGSGYVVSFLKGKPITIKNGTDGKKPVVEAAHDTDGILYWKIDGTWMMDNDKKIPVDAIAPQIRINEETVMWETSFDGGKTWTSSGVKASVEGGDAIFSQIPKISSDNSYYTFYLTGGETIKVPAYQETYLKFSIGEDPLTDLDKTIVLPAADSKLSYSIQSMDNNDISKLSVLAFVTEDETCKAQVDAGNISFTGLTDGKQIALEVSIVKNGKVLLTYNIDLAVGNAPVVVLPSITNITATAGTDKVTVTATFNSEVASLECHLYLNGVDKTPSFTKELTPAEISNGSCSFELGSGLTAGIYSLQVIPVSSNGDKGSVKTTNVEIKGAGTDPEPPVLTPAISSVANTAGADEAGVINLVAYWDSSLNNKITQVTYKLQDSNWKDVKSGSMTVYSDRAEIRITGLTPGGQYWPYVTPYIDSTEGSTFFMNDGIGMHAGKSDIVAPKLTDLKNMEEKASGVIQLSASWDSAFYGQITSVRYEIWNKSNYYDPDFPKTGIMEAKDNGTWACTEWLTGFTPGAVYDVAAWPYIGDTEGEKFTKDITAVQ